MTSVTVLSGRERRRRWTAAEKLRIVAESLSAGLSVVEFARRNDVHPNLVYAWRRQAQTGELSVAPDGETCFVPVSVAAAGSVACPAGDAAGVSSMVEVMLRLEAAAWRKVWRRGAWRHWPMHWKGARHDPDAGGDDQPHERDIAMAQNIWNCV